MPRVSNACERWREKEEAEGTVSVRSREAGDLGARSLEEFLKDVQEEIRTKAVK